MDEWDNDYEEEFETTRPRAEGVRILGAEEAAAAVSAQQAGGEPPLQEPLRFERRAAPEPPNESDDLWPVDEDPNPSGGFEAAAPPNLPHWTEPPTGEVPAILSGRFGESEDGIFEDGDGDDDLSAWSALSAAPRWRDQHDAWDDAGFDDASVLADPEPPLGALDETRGAYEFDGDGNGDDFESFDDFDVEDDEPAPIPLRPTPQAAQPTQSVPRVGGVGAARPRPPRPTRPTVGAGTGRPVSGGRDMQSAVILGGALGAIALVLFKLGPEPTMVLATLVVCFAAAELYDVLRRAGYQPATLVGLAGTLGVMVAAYTKGETALPLAVVLVLAASFLWYLIKVVQARPTVNVAATVMAFLWTGVLGSYAGLILGIDKQGHAGVAFLLGAVLATVASDVGAFFVGSRMGSRPLAPEISPNKTVEGLIGGAVAAVVVSFFILNVFPGVEPWDGGKAIWLGLVVAIVAPMGDLFESMIKRDLGIKDMGNLLPGHGGVLDRFDALLFVLPATYYLVRVLYF